MSQLADAADSSRSRLSHAVARLEDAGWVARGLCPTDRRGAVARLTDAGFEALADAAPGHADGVRTYVFDRLTPEQVDQLRDICQTISDGLRRAGPGAVEAGCDPPGASECGCGTGDACAGSAPVSER
jgi:DNA-binding MarR family transcriptional regulator